MATSVDTSRVNDRRQLRFENIDDALADVDRVVAAEKEGRLRTTGNWTPGQIMGHVASWIMYGYDGFPFPPPPWIIRVILRFSVRKMLKKGMPSGARIPKVENGTYATEPQETSVAAERLKAALQRLRDEPPRFDSPAFGKLSYADSIQLTLRHAELHMSFMVID